MSGSPAKTVPHVMIEITQTDAANANVCLSNDTSPIEVTADNAIKMTEWLAVNSRFDSQTVL